MDRQSWRLVMPVHLAESRQQAFDEARHGAAAWLVGTPDDAVAAIERLGSVSGGFGGLLGLAYEWAPREKILHSYELLARYVMPRYNGSLTGTVGSNAWARRVREELRTRRLEAIEKAHAAYEARQPASR
jgi:limonene 1,2-monooxygenase